MRGEGMDAETEMRHKDVVSFRLALFLKHIPLIQSKTFVVSISKLISFSTYLNKRMRDWLKVYGCFF